MAKKNIQATGEPGPVSVCKQSKACVFSHAVSRCPKEWGTGQGWVLLHLPVQLLCCGAEKCPSHFIGREGKTSRGR